ncbi:MAG: hypothetical protein HN356_07870 [Calditrichaeota bacterium]|nr:hypothetical protein [Calditrichota bacterium]
MKYKTALDSNDKRTLNQKYLCSSASYNSILLSLFIAVVILFPFSIYGSENEDCLGCHEDIELESEKGKLVGVNAASFSGSVHQDLSCTDCHTQSGDYEDTPHFASYREVDCNSCHDEAGASFDKNIHGKLHQSGSTNAPNCIICHGKNGNSHSIQPLDLRSAENACRQCHQSETDLYDSGKHSSAALSGKNSPGCVSCHPTHNAELPPSTGAINNLCKSCHADAMDQIHEGGQFEGAISCVACHDVHATHPPEGSIQACVTCHQTTGDDFGGSVHEDLIEEGDMNCLSCHKSHQMSDAPKGKDFGCGACHEDIEIEYRTSAHRLARLHNDNIAATCNDCHGGHHVLPASNPASSVSHHEIPNTCGKCHADKAVITSDYVRLPISLPRYKESIHGADWKLDKQSAVCTDCHGIHDLQSGIAPTSMIHKQNLASTCGKCHAQESKEYLNSIHGRALAHGVTDSPSCTDCHDEHLIFKIDDPRSKVHPGVQASETCAKCHEDPEMAARYGLPSGVIESYKDSYHGWAVKRDGAAVASCIDCHNTHDIGSLMDSTSSIHPTQVVNTCGKCHPKANANFAASYSHVLAQDKMMVHDWVKIIYIIAIIIILGGMFVHNAILFIHDLKHHYKHVHDQPTIVRMNKREVVQHLLLAISFTCLAITGFALRFPETWWVRILTEIGLNEENRRLTHRALAIIMVAGSFYHMYYLMVTRRGRMIFMAMLPVLPDVKHAIENIGYHLGFKHERPRFAMFDYTAKAEYWALIWGTVLMTITGLVLWFPAIATSWLPAWVVRVCEVVHFYEAILAVAAIIIWHFYFVIVSPREYPMSWIWITGKMPREEWEELHPESDEENNL